MSESTKYKAEGSRVYGNGYSYNLTSKIDAERLSNTLNNYEKNQIKNTTIQKQLKIIKMDLEILKHDINILKDKIE